MFNRQTSRRCRFSSRRDHINRFSARSRSRPFSLNRSSHNEAWTGFERGVDVQHRPEFCLDVSLTPYSYDKVSKDSDDWSTKATSIQFFEHHLPNQGYPKFDDNRINL